eukprot:SAG31_NODE_3874_length_3794_cov_2.431818_2_plen_175_part_00
MILLFGTLTAGAILAAVRTVPDPPVWETDFPIVSDNFLASPFCNSGRRQVLLLDQRPEFAAAAGMNGLMLLAGSTLVWLISIPAADVSLVDVWWGAAYVCQVWFVAIFYAKGQCLPPGREGGREGEKAFVWDLETAKGPTQSPPQRPPPPASPNTQPPAPRPPPPISRRCRWNR